MQVTRTQHRFICSVTAQDECSHDVKWGGDTGLSVLHGWPNRDP